MHMAAADAPQLRPATAVPHHPAGRTPRVGIGMPVYNGEQFVAQAIGSLLAQTFGDFQLVVCDNASTDGTEEICREFARRDARVRYVRNERNLGAAVNFNRTFALCPATPYFKWAAADDMHSPTYLERCVAALDADSSAVLAHSRTTVVDEQGRPIPETRTELYDPPRRLDVPRAHDRFRQILVHTKWCFEIFGLMRRACVARTALHESYYGSDKVLLSAMSLMGRFAEVPEALFFRRYHAGTSTSIKTAREREAWMVAADGGGAAAAAADERSAPAASLLAPVTPRVRCLRGYCHSIVAADHLALPEQAMCFAAVGSYLTRADKWAALVREPR